MQNDGQNPQNQNFQGMPGMGTMGTGMPGGFNPAMMQQFGTMPQGMQGFGAGTMPNFGMMPGMQTGGDGQMSQQQQMLQVMQQQMQQMQQLQQQMQGGVTMPMQGQTHAMQQPQQQNMPPQPQQMPQQMPQQHMQQQQQQQMPQQQMQPHPSQQQMPTAAGGGPASQEASVARSSDAFDSVNDTGKIFSKCVETLSEVEKEYYAELWAQAGCTNNTLQGRAAFDFLSKSKLPREILKRIWDLTDWKKQFFLGWEEFVVTMKLIAAAQKKQHVSLERLEYNCPTSMDCPEFDGIENVQAMLAKKAPPPAPEAGGPTLRSNAFDAFGELMGDLPEQSAAPQPLFVQPQAHTPEAPAPQQMAAAAAPGFPTTAVPQVSPDSVGDAGAGPAPPATAPTEVEFGDFSFQASPTPASPAPAATSPSAAIAAAPSEVFDAPATAAAPTNNPAAPTNAAWDAFGDDEPAFASAPVASMPSPSAASPAAISPSMGAPAAVSPSAAAPAPAAPAAPAGGGDWDAFGEGSFDPPKQDPVPPLAPAPSVGDGGDWAAFDSGSPSPALAPPPAAEGTWASFEAAPAPAPAPAATGAPGDDEEWDAFGSAPAPSAAPPAATSEGDLWSKMSAFDDLMPKEEAPPAPPAQTTPSGGGSPAPAEGMPSPNKAPDSFDLLGGSDAGAPPPTAPTSANFGADFGTDFAPGPPAPAPTAFAAFDEDDDDFGTFDGGAAKSTPETQQAPKPAPPTSGNFDLTSMDFGSTGAAEAPKPASTDDWAFGFGGGDAKEEASAVPKDDGFGAFGGGASDQAFEADFGDFASPSPAPPPPPPAASGGSPSDLGNFGNFGDFGTSVPNFSNSGPGTSGTPDQGFGDFGSFPAPPSSGAKPAENAPSAVWADFASADNGANGDFGDFSGAGAADAAEAESEIASALKSLAKELAIQGHFEEARACQVGLESARKSEAAGRKQKEAASKGKLEEAMSLKKDIEALEATVPNDDKIQAWKRLADFPASDPSMSSLAERLEQRCQCIDSDLDRDALMIALENFRSHCPPTQLPTDILSELPILLGQQRAAKRMSRAIDAAISGGLLRFLQVLVVSLIAMADLVGTCAEQLLMMMGPDWTPQDREDALASSELEEFLRGLATLRRIFWRVRQASDLFLPGINAQGTRDASLEDTLGKLRSALDKAQAAWATAESALKNLESGLRDWDPVECFEATGKQEGGASAPLCTLCLLPAQPPFSMEVSGGHYDGGVASSLWKGGLWHLQCANFWVRHGAQCQTLKELGLGDPFQQQNAFDF